MDEIETMREKEKERRESKKGWKHKKRQKKR